MGSKKDERRSRRTVEVIASSYQPSKADLEEDVSLHASPDEVARALVQTVRVRRLRATSVRTGKPARK